jgi:hypothetical protein
MNRAPFQLVDSRGLMGQLSAVSDHYQRKGATNGVCRIGCQWQEPGGVRGQ